MRKMFTRLFSLTLLVALVSAVSVLKAQTTDCFTIAGSNVVLVTDPATVCDSADLLYEVVGYSGAEFAFNFDGNATGGFTSDSTVSVPEGVPFTVQVNYGDTCYSNVLTVTNASIIEPVQIQPSEVESPLCYGENGEITIMFDGDHAPYKYYVVSNTKWQDPAQNPIANPTLISNYQVFSTQVIRGPGSYWVAVQDANDCVNLLDVANWDSTWVDPAPAQLVYTDVNGVDPTCIGGEGTVTVTGIGGGMPFTDGNYLVTVGDSTKKSSSGTAVFNMVAGTYTATIVDSFGCELTTDSMAVLTDPDEVTFDISIDDVSCADSTTGSIFVHTFDGGSGAGFEASLGDGVWVPAVSDTAKLTGLSAGYYSVYVRDNSGCDSVGYVNPNNTQNTVSVQSPGGIEYDVVVDTVVCLGDSSTITVANIDGGSGSYEYSVDGGTTWGTDYSWRVPAGTYTVVVRDADVASCEIAYPAITLTDPAGVTINDVATVSPTCPGGNDGVINVDAEGEVGRTLEYSIDSINWYTNNIFAVAAGSYTVYVRDMICTDSVKTWSASVDALDENVIAIYAKDTFIACYGDDNGYVMLEEYSWADQTGSDGRVVSYYMTTDEDELYVSGDSTTTGYYNNLAPGTYYFWASDNIGCVSKNTITVIVTENQELTIGGDVTKDATCFDAYDGVMTITAGTGTPTVYGHANTLQAAMNLPSGAFTTWPADTNMVEIQVGKGTYYVVAKDACGDKAYAGPFTVGGLDEVTIVDTAMSVTDIVCYGDSTGVIEVYPAEGGTEDFTYTLKVQTGPSTWVNVAPYVDVTSTVFEQLPAATYKVVVTDNGGCNGTETGAILVDGPDSPLYRYDEFERNISCYGASDGAIGIWMEGGTPPYQFKIGTAGWRDFPEVGYAGGHTQEIVITEPGTYTVWVRDSLGCMSVDGPYTYTIAEPDPIVITVDVTDVTNTCDADNGALEISVEGGWYSELETDFSIFVNGVEEGSHVDSGEVVTVSDLGAGQYTIDVVENHAYGCEISKTVVINAPDTVTATAEVTTDVLCNGGDNGVITVSNMSGGTVDSIYNVTISPAMGVKDTIDGNIVFSELPADTFDITVTDDEGCSYTINNVIVTEPTALALNATHIADITCVSDGSFSVQATGGVGDYKYFAALSILPQHVLIPAPESPAWQEDSIFTVSAAGTYIVWAMDANGCVIGGEENSMGDPVNAWRVKIEDPEVIVTVDADAILGEVACNGDMTDTIVVNSVVITRNGVPVVDPTYDVTINDVATDTLAGVGAGTYVVVVTDESGCYGTDTVTVTEPEVLDVILDIAQGEFSCPDVTEGYIEAVATGGTPWDGGPEMTAELKSANNNAAYSDYEFQLWQDGVLKTDYIDIDAFLVKVGHTYQVVVRDANGCTDTSNVITVAPVAPVVIDTIVDVTCSSDTLGSVMLTVSGQDGRTFTVYYDQIESESPEDSGSAVVSEDGTVKLDQVLMFDNENIDDIHYAIWVEDNMGCVSGTDTITIDQIITSPLELVVTEGSMEACQEEITVSASGGVAPYVFTVDGVEMAATTVLIGGGAHLVEATDAHGCVVSQEVVVDYAATLDTTVTIYEGDTANFVYETIDTMLVGGSYTFLYNIDTVCIGEVNVEVVELPKVAPVLVDWTPTDTIADNHPVFELTFNTGVSLGDGGNLYVIAPDSTVSLTLALTEAMFSDSTITVDYDWTVSGTLDLNTTYTVHVDSAAVMGQGYVWEGIMDNSWMFTTGDSVKTPVIQIETADFKVYPNPFNNFIRIDNAEKLSRVVVSNIAGQRVLDIENPTYEIRTGNLVTGVYVVTLISDGEIVKSERIIKR